MVNNSKEIAESDYLTPLEGLSVPPTLTKLSGSK